jgi:energy-coupling factor transporter transmembrane protein EcfT
VTERFDLVTHFLLIPFLLLVFAVGTVEKLRGADVSVPFPLVLLLMGALGLFLWAYWRRKFPYGV